MQNCVSMQINELLNASSCIICILAFSMRRSWFTIFLGNSYSTVKRYMNNFKGLRTLVPPLAMPLRLSKIDRSVFWNARVQHRKQCVALKMLQMETGLYRQWCVLANETSMTRMCLWYNCFRSMMAQNNIYLNWKVNWFHSLLGCLVAIKMTR